VWILAAALGTLLFLVILLAVPVDLVFQVEKGVELRSRVRVGWLFGLVWKDLTGREKKPKPKKKKKPKPKKKKSREPFLAFLGAEGFLLRLFGLVRRLFRLLKVRQLDLDLTVGLGDPADTGMLFGVVGPAAACLGSLSPGDVQIRPDFVEESFRGHFKGDVRVFPIQFVATLAGFVLSPTTLKAIKAWMTARRK
jgi:hypothetical protein